MGGGFKANACTHQNQLLKGLRCRLAVDKPLVTCTIVGPIVLLNKLYCVYANSTHDSITARKFNSRNCLYSIRTETTACNYFL